MANDLVDRMNDLVWGDTLERRGLPGRVVSTALRYGYAVLRDLISGQLTLRAMSLVYTTLLAVVPLIAFSFSVLKGLGVHRQLEGRMYLLLEPLGEKGVEITDNLMELVHNVNGGVLGSISLAFFLYTAVLMVQKVEESFNYVWYVSESRGFARRFTEYMFVMLVGPVVIVLALGMITSLYNQSIAQYMRSHQVLGPLLVAASRLTPYVLVTGVFTFLYVFMPNTRVRLRPALAGGVAGGFLWASISLGFTAFVVNSARTQAVYASFAIAIITLIWLYLNWLVLLIGAQLAFYFQNPAYLRMGRREPRLSNSMRERLVLNIMLLVGRAFRDPGRTIDLPALSEALSIPSMALEPIVAALERNGLLTFDENGMLLPGCEMKRIRLRDILAVVRAEGETGSHRDPEWTDEIDRIGRQLDAAVAERAGDRTLSGLLDECDPPGRASAGRDAAE